MSPAKAHAARCGASTSLVCSLVTLLALGGCRVGPASGTRAPATSPPAAAPAPRPLPAPSRAAPPTPRDPLADDADARFAERVRIGRLSTLRFRDSGPAVADVEPPERVFYPETENIVVAHNRRSVRVVEHSSHVRFLGWIDREDLQTVVTSVAHIDLHPGESGDEPLGVVAYPGLPVEPLESVGGTTRIEHDDAIVTFSGWLPSSALGTVYRRTEVYPDPWPWIESRRITADGASFHASAGDRLGAFPTSGAVVNVVGVDAVGRAEILYAGEGYRVRGLMSAAVLAAPAAPGWGQLATALGGRPLVDVTVPAGTCALDGPDGEIVGLLFRDAHAPVERDRDGRAFFVDDSPWGQLTFWLRDAPDGSGFVSCDPP